MLYDLYKKVGNAGFGGAVGQIAPYFATINPQFVMLEPGYCEIILQHTKAVQNHLGTVHAIAICNGAELVAGLMTDVSIPENRRWIPTAMSVKYLAKATTDLHIITEGKDIDWSIVGSIEVDVNAIDNVGKRVFSAQITMQVGEK